METVTMNFDFITENIAVGQRIDTQGFADALGAAGITHVLNVFGGMESCWRGPVCYVPQEDNCKPRTPEQVFAAIRYGFDVLRDRGKLYIHCELGRGRAPSSCYAILRRFGLSKDEAKILIDAKRPACVGHWQIYIPSIEEALAVP